MDLIKANHLINSAAGMNPQTLNAMASAQSGEPAAARDKPEENLLVLVKPDETDVSTSSSETSKSVAFTSPSKDSSKNPVSSTNDRGLLGLVNPRTWRRKLTIKNKEYPRVTSPGTYFISHSGGFQLYQQNTRRYLGHYTKAAIRELEGKYAKKRK
jgi:hypothetical protein